MIGGVHNFQKLRVLLGGPRAAVNRVLTACNYDCGHSSYLRLLNKTPPNMFLEVMDLF